MALFLWFKDALVLAALAFAVREVRATYGEDGDPELTAKLVRVFSASRRARRGVRPAPTPPATEAEAARRAA